MKNLLGLLMGGFLATANRFQKRKTDFKVASRPFKTYDFEKAKARRKMAKISRRINRK